jgi:hypothetical protein
VDAALSKTQIDRLGERLRDAPATVADLELLDAYRRSFERAYGTVVDAIRAKLGLKPTGRPAKSTSSVVDKLRRESIRLTQIQDIAGCRLVVENIKIQDRTAALIQDLFTGASLIDRRRTPSHGYRAVHVVVKVDTKAIEIQVRTSLQHGWAQLSEFYADQIDPAIKYGGGPEPRQGLLLELSDVVTEVENMEERVEAARPSPDSPMAEGRLSPLRVEVSALNERVVELINSVIRLTESEGSQDDLSHRVRASN